MTDLRQAAEMALEALEDIWGYLPAKKAWPQAQVDEAITALRQALEQPEQKWDSRHPKAQALIGERARLKIELWLVERLVDDPHFETTPSDTEYWQPLHDKLKEALTQSEQEPVAWMTHSDDLQPLFHKTRASALNWQLQPTPLYTAPPQKEWVGLGSDEDILEISKEAWGRDKLNWTRTDHRQFYVDFAREIDRRLKEKNHG